MLTTRLKGSAVSIALALCLGVSIIAADKISSTERSKLVAELEESRNLLANLIQGMSREQLEFKPGPFRWSIAQNLEHITIAEHTLGNLITVHMMKSLEEPSSQEQQRVDSVSIEEIIQWLEARETSFQAPQRVRPSGKWGTPENTLKAFSVKRDELIQFARTTDKDLHRAVAPNPVFGPMDAYQWMFFASGHVRRHLIQMKEVKSHPDFPR